jgi:hypothetical protein
MYEVGKSLLPTSPSRERRNEDGNENEINNKKNNKLKIKKGNKL